MALSQVALILEYNGQAALAYCSLVRDFRVLRNCATSFSRISRLCLTFADFHGISSAGIPGISPRRRIHRTLRGVPVASAAFMTTVVKTMSWVKTITWRFDA